MTAAEIYKYVADRFKGGSIDDTAAEIRKLESLLHALSVLRNRVSVADMKHATELASLATELNHLQSKCPHDWRRSTAESDTMCSICGATDD